MQIMYDYGLLRDTNPFEEVIDNMITTMDTLTNTGNWVAYWAFEKNWGKDMRPDSVTDENGNPIPMNTARELWAFLNSNLPGAWQNYKKVEDLTDGQDQ